MLYHATHREPSAPVVVVDAGAFLTGNVEVIRVVDIPIVKRRRPYVAVVACVVDTAVVRVACIRNKQCYSDVTLQNIPKN